MKRLPFFIVLFLLTNSSIYATVIFPFGEVIPTRKPLVLNTLVVNKGVPNAVIASPNSLEYRTLALKVQQAVKVATGATLQIINLDKIVNQRGEFKAANPQTSIITLGNLENNGLIAHLYFRGYCGVNANYPGVNGYVIQTVTDPWATDANTIVLGGSNLTGVKRAVQRFCSELPRRNTLNLPRTLRAEYDKNYEAADPSDTEMAKILENATIEFKAGKHNGLFDPISKAGIAYNLTGKEGQARLFRELLLLNYQLSITVPKGYDSPWGGGADMKFADLIMAWDNVEESPSISESDRQKIMDVLLKYIHYYETYAYISYFKTSGIRHNHHTFPGQGFSAAGRYFTKYFPGFADGEKWLKMGDDCFKVQQTSWKTQENSSAYVSLATRHMSYYATTRPDFTWFDSGRAAKSGDLSIMTMDNLGSQCAFGDMEGWNPISHFTLWHYLITVNRDGRYSWAIHKARNVIRKTATENDSLPVNIAPVEPADLLGVKFMPLDSLFFTSLNGQGRNAGKVPREQGFDKLTFRSSFDPQREYLAIDGINTGYHSHKDGNSVLRLSDRGRIWLADGDYIKASAKYHNTLLIFRNGQATSMPPFIRRDLIADLPAAGLTRTTMPDYGGTDWSRNIIWDKGRAFVFIDEVKANSSESYSIRTLWHTLGTPSLDNNTFSLRQKGESFVIRNLDGSQLRTTADPLIGKNWASYKYAEPVIQSLQQIRNATLKAGDKLFVINVMSAQADGAVPLTASRVNDSTLVLGSGADRTLIGVGNLSIKGIEATTQLYRIAASNIALAGASQLALGGSDFFTSDQPVALELSKTGTTITTDKKTKVAFYHLAGVISVDGKAIKPSRQSAMMTLEKGKHFISGIMFPKALIVNFPESVTAAKQEAKVNVGTSNLKQLAQFEFGNAQSARPFAADANGVYVAATDGIIYALTQDLKPRWNFKVGGNLTAVWTGKLGKNDPPRIVAGNAEGRVAVLDQSGKLVWEQLIPLNWKTRAVNCFTSADLKGDGNRALIAGSQNWYNYAYEPESGKMIWDYNCIRGASAGGAYDLNGDGKEEVLSVTEYYTWGAVNPDDGKPVWTIRGGPGGSDVAAADLKGENKPIVFMAGLDGNLYAVSADGKRLWTYNTGDGATCIQFIDVNNDGRQEVLTGTLSGDLVALNADGERVWRKEIGEPLLCMIKADLDSDGKADIVIGTEDGRIIALNADGNAFAGFKASGSISKLVALPDGRIIAGTGAGKVIVLGLN